MNDEIDLLEVLEPLRTYLGTWRGEGTGVYPTIDTFRYVEETRFWHAGKPFLGFEQRTRDAVTGAPMHAESGFWRVVGDAAPAPEQAGIGAGPGSPDASALAIEAVIAHPSGLAEVLIGTAAHGRIHVVSDTIARTPTAKEVSIVTRTMTVAGDELTYELHMAAVGQPLQLHLTATLHRVG